MDLASATVDALFTAALQGDEDNHPAWEAITELQRRGTMEIFRAARALLHSQSAKERGRGVDVLAQLGCMGGGDPVHQPCANALIDLLGREAEPSVLHSLGVAFGHRPDARAIPRFVELSRHPDEDVRFGAVWALTPHTDLAAVETLIHLTGDADLDVRNWATFGLGTQLEQVDTPALRDALARRLTDSDAEVRGEALTGLVVRRDPRALEPLRRELSANEVNVLAVEAAAQLGDPSLLPLLESLRDPNPGDEYFDKVLDDAIRTLRNATPR